MTFEKATYRTIFDAHYISLGMKMVNADGINCQRSQLQQLIPKHVPSSKGQRLIIAHAESRIN